MSLDEASHFNECQLLSFSLSSSAHPTLASQIILCTRLFLSHPVPAYRLSIIIHYVCLDAFSAQEPVYPNVNNFCG